MRVNIWLLRIVWAAVPIAAGGAVEAATGAWDAPTVRTLSVLLWAAWALGLLGLARPGLWTITGVRVLASLALAAAVAAAVQVGPTRPAVATALGVTAGAAVLAAAPAFARACLQATAYGSEERFPLRTPPALFLGILPAAAAVVGAGALAGPLLVAAGRGPVGVAVWAAGWAAAGWALGRLQRLAGRFVVLVPAGLVVVDPLSLTDPVLCTRDRLRRLRPFDPRRAPPEGAEDLRLGAGSGTLLVELDPPVEIPRRQRGRTELRRAAGLLVACATPVALCTRAAARRLPVGTPGHSVPP
jgi:hypothetical protein